MHKNKNTNSLYKKAAKLFIVTGFILAVFFIAHITLAETLDVGLEYGQATGLSNTDIRLIVARIIRAFLGLVGMIFLVIVIYGGYMYMVSQGEPEKTLKARKIIIAGIIGLIIMLSAFSIVTWIINLLIKATGIQTDYTAGPPWGSAGGALGGGIIETHYPPRDAVGIARNTSIVITFKEEMLLPTLIRNSNGSYYDVGNNGKYDEGIDSPVYGDCIDIEELPKFAFKNSEGQNVYINYDEDQFSDYAGVDCDLINDDFVIISKLDNVEESLTNEFDIRASATSDGKTVVFKPYQYLGSDSENVWHQVLLTGDIKKHTGEGAFGSFGNYYWQFKTSTELDLDPPQVVSVIPLPSDSDTRIPKNSVVQINFDEPINPVVLTGQAQIEGGGRTGANLAQNTFDYIQVKHNDNSLFVAGSFVPANGYQTVEYLTTEPCGINSCGEEIYCLPGDSDISVKVLAAALDQDGKPSAYFPYTGIVDMADNSLNGNKNDEAQGPEKYPDGTYGSGLPAYNLNNPNPTEQGDDLIWTFYTSNVIDLDPPVVERYFPAAGSLGTDPRHSILSYFSEYMMKSTIKPDSGYGDGYCPCDQDGDCGDGQSCSNLFGYCVNNEDKRIICTPTIACKGTTECKENEHITLVQPPDRVLIKSGTVPVGYWLISKNIIDNNMGKTRARLNHGELGEYLEYGVNLGSGLKDQFQNCFLPSGGQFCTWERRDPDDLASPFEPVEGEWTESNIDGVDYTFPTCDLTKVSVGSEGNFILSHNVDGENTLENIQAFYSPAPVEDFYGYDSETSTSALDTLSNPFDKLTKPNQTAMFLYYGPTRENSQNVYNLVVVNNTNTDGQADLLSMTLSGLDDSTMKIIEQDDPGDSYSAIQAENIDVNWDWDANQTDGLILTLGDRTDTWTITAKFNDLTNHFKCVSQRHVGGALAFSNSSDYVNLGNKSDFNLTGDVSVSVWVNPDDLENEPAIIRWQDESPFGIRILKDGKIEFVLHTQEGDWENPRTNLDYIETGNWQNIVIVREQEIYKIYYQGVMVQTIVSPNTPSNGSGNLILGGLPTEIQEYHGRIDEVLVYNRALTDDEIEDLYNDDAGLYNAPTAGLLAGWHLDEGESNIINDYTGNGYNGILQDGPTWAGGKVIVPAGISGESCDPQSPDVCSNEICSTDYLYRFYYPGGYTNLDMGQAFSISNLGF